MFLSVYGGFCISPSPWLFFDQVCWLFCLLDWAQLHSLVSAPKTRHGPIIMANHLVLCLLLFKQCASRPHNHNQKGDALYYNLLLCYHPETDGHLLFFLLLLLFFSPFFSIRIKGGRCRDRNLGFGIAKIKFPLERMDSAWWEPQSKKGSQGCVMGMRAERRLCGTYPMQSPEGGWIQENE